MPRREDSGVAIVGMACVFPGAPDLATFWHNIESGADLVGDVPADRWDASFYDPAGKAEDRVYSRRGGFVTARFDALAFGVMPVAVSGAEPDQLLALQTAAQALEDAGYATRAFARERTAVILGRGGYLGPGLAKVDQRVRGAAQLGLALETLVPGLSAETIEAVKREFRGKLPAFGPDTAIGLVPNLAASRIAQRLDLHGPAYTIDAACASSLLAVDQAVGELTRGRCDLALAGGVHLCQDIVFWSVFSQLGALSRDQTIRPYDRRADGLVIGEGVGILVLKRLAEAQKDGDRIYAVVRGTGVSSDGRSSSLMNPAVEGQVLSLRRAWEESRLDPRQVGLVEGHGTGTAAGDAAELATLRAVFGEADEGERLAVLGSVKSQIGHAMPAAGAAGLIKAALAIHHGVLPPTIHCEEPREELARTRFRVLAKAEPWEAPSRIAGVNAFGFGGIDAHVVLSSFGSPARQGLRPAAQQERIFTLAARTPEGLIAALDRGEEGGEGPCRLAIVGPGGATPEKKARARVIAGKGRPWRGREDIYFTPQGLAAQGGKVAFMFPGVEATFEPRVDDVAERFGLPKPAPGHGTDLERTGLAIITVGRLLHTALDRLGVRPDAMLGHSIGEWSGMIASGMIPSDAVDAFISTLVPFSLEVPGVVFAAAGCGADRARAAMRGLIEIALSHDNCPHQVILCGNEGSIDAALKRLTADGVLCQKLPFKSGFHSPLFEGFLAPHRQYLARLPLTRPKVPLWSATTCAPYPDEPPAMRDLAVQHLIRPVRFRELVEAMYEKGFRVFVQVGAGSGVVGFVEDILKGRDAFAMSANVKLRPGMAQLRRLAAGLWTEGVAVDLSRLSPGTKASPSRPVALDLGAPLVRLDHPLPVTARPPEPPRSTNPVLREFATALAEIESAEREVLAAFEGAKERASLGPRELVEKERFSVERFPFLVDHTFYRQPPGWKELADRYPVVPMTMTLETMLEKARALVPERVPIALEGVRAWRWLAVEPPVEVEVSARFDGAERVKVTIEGYADGTVVLASSWPPAPPSDPATFSGSPRTPVPAERLYSDRWMFHGPAYQGIRVISPMGKDGLRGVIETGAAKGALLDNAGQLFGYWVMEHTEVDRMAMPVRIERASFFGPHPEAGERLDCVVRIKELSATTVRADLSLARGDRLWCRIDGWEDRRFDTQPTLWEVLRYPEKNLLAEIQEGGVALVTDAWRSPPSRDLLARRYLGARELAEYRALLPPRQGPWLNGRIAVKDAVRDFLWRRGAGPMFPVELGIENDEKGRPVVRGPFGRDLRVSLAHKEGIAVALVAEGRDVGVDIELVEARSDDMVELAFSETERRLLPADDRFTWLTRFWAAKEAYAKARGEGFMGNPRRFVVEKVDGDRLRVVLSGGREGSWVETRVRLHHALAWTVP